MADFKIKSTAGTGNLTLLQSQDQSGSDYAIKIGDSGASTLTNATLTAPTITDLSNVTGTLPVGVTGGSGLTALGTVTSGGFASGNRQSVEIWYEARVCHNNASYTEHQEIGDWGLPFNMETGNHNVIGRSPAGFTAVSAIKVGVMNIQGQYANQGISMRWMIAAGAGNGQAHNTHSLGNTNVTPFPNTDSNSNHVYEANVFNLTGSNDFEDIIADGDYFAFAFDDLVSHNSAVMGVAITWDF